MPCPVNTLDMAYEISLKDKVAVVTGGGGGIGSEICRTLAFQAFNCALNCGAARLIETDVGGRLRECRSKEIPTEQGNDDD